MIQIYLSLTAFLSDIARGNPVLYAATVLLTIGLLALAMHGALERLLRIMRL